MRGYIDVGGKPVRWRGMTASYTVAERSVMRLMPAREQAIVHTLKALTLGEIADVEAGHSVLHQSANHGAVRPADEAAVGEKSLTHAGPGVMTGSASSGITLIDPEDIAFGKPKKKRPVYALVWTWRQNRVVKTKALGTRKMRAWKKWYERQGWKVMSHSDGYFAVRGSEKHVISLHEYDRDTNERLK